MVQVSRLRRAALPVVLLLTSSLLLCSAWILPSHPASPPSKRAYSIDALAAKRPAKAKGAPSSAKGFGSSSGGAGGAGGAGKLDLVRDRPTLEFMDWLEKGGAQVAHLAIANLGSEKLRGMVALKPFKKGDVILSIPYEMALDVTPPLGIKQEPLTAALQLLDMTKTMDLPKSYLALLPTPQTVDYASTTDFFTREELDMLQWPPVTEETEARMARLQAVAEEKGVALDDLKWAFWMVVSRSLGVQGTTGQRQLLIPFLDMCNHRASGRHILTGRATAGGQLRILAGEDVQIGDEVTFLYGAGTLNSVRLIQDYGFIDPESTLLSDKRTAAAAAPSSLEALKATSLEEDLALLQTTTLSGNQALAVSFRIAMKRAVEAAKTQ